MPTMPLQFNVQNENILRALYSAFLFVVLRFQKVSGDNAIDCHQYGELHVVNYVITSKFY